MSTALVGTRPLLHATIRHNGRNFAPWVGITAALCVSSVLAYPWVFPTAADRTALVTGIGANPALGLIFGPAYDLQTVDGFTAWRGLALGGVFAALGAIFAVTRNTRAQEDSGQAELLASGVLGRSSRLLAGVAAALLASLILGVVTGVLTSLFGGNWESSLLLGAGFTLTGSIFAGVAAVTAQLGSDARTANTIATGILGVLFLLRGVAYSLEAPEWTVWINPLGWIQETQPAHMNRWWPLLPALALTVTLLYVAFALQARRDFGQGAIAPQPGPDRGTVRTIWRLTLRLNRGPSFSWAIAATVLGLVFGYFATSITSLLRDNSAVAQVLAAGATTPQELVGAFLVTILSLVGILLAVPGVHTVIKIRREELEERLEPILATGISRSRYYASNVTLAFAGPTVFVLVSGFLISVLAASANIGIDFGTAILQTVATVPAVWTVISVSVAVIGARPAVSIAAWVGVLESFAITLFGPTFGLPNWAMAMSPFWHVPNVAADGSWLGLIWIILVALGLTAVGFAGFNKRDLGY